MADQSRPPVLAPTDNEAPPGLRWFDHHCHLTTAKADPEDLVEAARLAGVDHLVTVGCDVEDSRRAIDVAARFDQVWATAGVHPHDADGGIDGLRDLLGEAGVVAVGECGLDYYYDNSDRAAQRRVFAEQIELAHSHDLPLVIHSRDAWDDTLAILDEHGLPRHTVFHCFTGGPVEAERCLDRGAFLSFSGIVTFNNAKSIQQAAAMTPIDRILVETDSPFLTPVPYRGSKNQPSLVTLVGQKIADVKNLSVDVVASSTWENTRDFYGV